MKLEKIVKKEEKSQKRFLIFMSILFVLLPIILYLSGIKTLFIISFLLLIELLIILCIIIKVNYYTLKFSYSNNKLKLKSGLFSKECLLICDKVVILHTVKSEEEIELIIVSKVNIRNRNLKPITKSFMKKYPEAAHEYIRLKKMYPENIYYYQVIKRGGFKKYLLLDSLYKNCVRAVITNPAIENIKISRGQCEL